MPQQFDVEKKKIGIMAIKKKDVQKPTNKKSDDPCWDGYKKVGMKIKKGKKVPNCVPEK